MAQHGSLRAAVRPHAAVATLPFEFQTHLSKSKYRMHCGATRCGVHQPRRCSTNWRRDAQNGVPPGVLLGARLCNWSKGVRATPLHPPASCQPPPGAAAPPPNPPAAPPRPCAHNSTVSAAHQRRCEARQEAKVLLLCEHAHVCWAVLCQYALTGAWSDVQLCGACCAAAAAAAHPHVYAMLLLPLIDVVCADCCDAAAAHCACAPGAGMWVSVLTYAPLLLRCCASLGIGVASWSDCRMTPALLLSSLQPVVPLLTQLCAGRRCAGATAICRGCIMCVKTARPTAGVDIGAQSHLAPPSTPSCAPAGRRRPHVTRRALRPLAEDHASCTNSMRMRAA